MAHTYDTKAQFTTGAADPTDFSYTCGSGATVLVLLIVGAGTTLRTGAAPTYNGVSMTAGDSEVNLETFCELWYLLDPPTGASYTIRIQNDNTRTIFGCAASFKAATGKTSELRACGPMTGTTANPGGPTMTGLAAGDVIVSILGTGDNSFAPSAMTGTELYTYDPAAYGMGSQYYICPDTADRSLTWTEATADDWNTVAASFKESANASVAINNTSANGTGAVGTLALALAMAISGVAGTGEVGDVGRNIDIALAGNGATATVGTVSYGGSCSVGDVALGMEVALTGAEATGEAGTLTPVSSVDAPISGVEATASVGTMPPMMAVVLSGIEALGEAGTVGQIVTVPMTGIPATGEVGTLVYSVGGVDVPITGVGATVAVGTVSYGGSCSVGDVAPDVAMPLAGASTTGEVGTVTPSVGGDLNLPVTGNLASGAIGSLLPESEAALSGIEASVSAGAIPPDMAIPLSGASASGAIGNVLYVAEGDINIPITGVSANPAYPLSGVAAGSEVGSVGYSAQSVNFAISGVAATGTVGTVSYPQTTGPGMTGYVGSVGLGTVVPLPGAAGTGAVGTIAPARSGVISGLSATLGAGSVVARQTVDENIYVALTSVYGDTRLSTLRAAQNTPITGNAAMGEARTIPSVSGGYMPRCVIPLEDPLSGAAPPFEGPPSDEDPGPFEDPLSGDDPDKESPWTCR